MFWRARRCVFCLVMFSSGNPNHRAWTSYFYGFIEVRSCTESSECFKYSCPKSSENNLWSFPTRHFWVPQLAGWFLGKSQMLCLGATPMDAKRFVGLQPSGDPGLTWAPCIITSCRVAMHKKPDVVWRKIHITGFPWPWGYPNSWMIFWVENPFEIDDLGVPPWIRKPHIPSYFPHMISSGVSLRLRFLVPKPPNQNVNEEVYTVYNIPA